MLIYTGILAISPFRIVNATLVLAYQKNRGESELAHQERHGVLVISPTFQHLNSIMKKEGGMAIQIVVKNVRMQNKKLERQEKS